MYLLVMLKEVEVLLFVCFGEVMFGMLLCDFEVKVVWLSKLC